MSMYVFLAVSYIGLISLIVGVGAIVLGAGEARARRIVERTPAVPLGSWPPRRRLAANAVTDFGAAGPVVAPVSGVACTWFVAELNRKPARGFDTEYSDEDTLWRHHMSDLPIVRDGSGRLLIGDELLERPPHREHPLVTVTTTREYRHDQLHEVPDFLPPNYHDTRSHESLELTETRLDSGVPVFLIGQAVRHHGGPRLAAARGPVTILTSDTSAAVVRRLQDARRNSRSLAKGLLISGAIIAAIGVAGLLLASAVGF
jgi:hypothetical protein